MGTIAITTDRGIFYRVADNGDLLWYQDLRQDGTNGMDGTTGWAAASGSRIGTGWAGFSQVFSGGGGHLYAIKPTGELLWYRDTQRNGTPGWAPGSGRQIGAGWNMFSTVFSGGNGVIYGVKPTGELLWYRDLRRDGSNAPNGSTGWDGASGTTVGTGWGGFQQVFSGGNGAIYAITDLGLLRWYRDTRWDGRAGSGSRWDARSGSAIGQGWDVFTTAMPGGNGIIYALTVDGFLLWYHDLAGNGTSQWAGQGLGCTVRGGWFLTQPLESAVQGYCVPLSAEPGQEIAFKVSASTEYAVTYLRLGPQPHGAVGVPVAGQTQQAAQEQEIPQLAWRDGCGWGTSFSTVIPADWRSGIYAARCTADDGTDAYLPFVVKPAPSARAPFAVLANTNTWNAYNDWGGRSKYSAPPAALLSTERPNPAASPVDDGQINHLTRAELWVLGWLEDAGYSVDVYTDHDFHAGIDGLQNYKALLLTTHPEYWSAQMLDNLQAYLAGGGCLLYLGGNGVFERIDYRDDTGTTMVFLGGDAGSQRARSYFRNLTPPRPERAVLGVAYRYEAYMTFAPFRVLAADHAFFDGSGLSNGDLIGADGLNGAGSGWEMDTSLPGLAPDGVVVTVEGASDRGRAPDNLVLLARGTNPGYGADMTCYETPAGGFVFAAGSISFGGALAKDAALQAILRNVLAESLNRPLAPQ